MNNCFQRVADCFDRRSMINQLAPSQECRQACKKKKKKKKDDDKEEEVEEEEDNKEEEDGLID